jgi:hypothetical protein
MQAIQNAGIGAKDSRSFGKVRGLSRGIVDASHPDFYLSRY